jgi:serine/threonine-protein kinase RsbW
VTTYAGGLGATERQREDIALAVSEAVSNAVLHAYADHEVPGDVGVSACMTEGALEVTVCDEGSGIVPRPQSPGLGLGLALMGRMAEQMRLEHHDAESGTRVRMTFAIG